MKAKPIWRLWPQKICLQRTFHRNTYKNKVIKRRHVSNEPFKEKSPKLIMIKWVRSGIISRMTLIKLCDWCWHYLLRVNRYILSFCHFVILKRHIFIATFPGWTEKIHPMNWRTRKPPAPTSRWGSSWWFVIWILLWKPTKKPFWDIF